MISYIGCLEKKNSEEYLIQILLIIKIIKKRLLDSIDMFLKNKFLKNYTYPVLIFKYFLEFYKCTWIFKNFKYRGDYEFIYFE